MSNKLKFLIEYQKYIESLECISNRTHTRTRNGEGETEEENDDIQIYEKMKHQRLIEGLIHTYPSVNSANILQRRFKELCCTIEDDGEISILLRDPCFVEKYLPLINNLGYFISQMYDVENGTWIKGYDINIKTFKFDIEPKYDLEILPLPDVLYHATENSNYVKINKIGLVPKSGNKLSSHPERIYLTDSLKMAKLFSNYIHSTYNKESIILEIDTIGLNMKLYSDLNMRDKGYYTLSNIPSRNIKIYEE